MMNQLYQVEREEPSSDGLTHTFTEPDIYTDLGEAIAYAKVLAKDDFPAGRIYVAIKEKESNKFVTKGEMAIWER